MKESVREALVVMIPECPWPYFDSYELIEKYSFLIERAHGVQLSPEDFAEMILIYATLP